MNYEFLENIEHAVEEIPPQSIVSRNVYKDGSVNVILFGFAAGEELSEHTSAKPAILHILEGKADLVLGADKKNGQPGTWVFMPPNLPHSVFAQTQVRMLLIMLSN